jgi:glycosyltransferase involved in cell wall biosynthesis
VGDAGITVPQGNAEALAAAIRKLLSDRNYWKALSERSQERSEYFSMLCFRQSISDLIKDVADYDKSKLAEVRRC